jgi:hypothetical protein
MNKYLFSCLLFISLFFSCKQSPDDAVTNAKKKSNTINEKLKDYREKRVDDIVSKAAGTITGYYRDEEIKKIYAEHFSDTNRVFTEYYFDDGMLIYIMQQNFVYNRPVTYTEEKAKAHDDTAWYDDRKTRLEITRYYFHKNNLVRWIAPGNIEEAAGTTAFVDKQSLLWAETAILIKELKEQQ